MKWCRLIFVTSFFLSMVCGVGPSAATAQTSSGSDFASLCQAVGADKGQITREQFIASAKDKEAAAQLFDACDANRDKILSEEEARQERMNELKRQVLPLTTP